MYLYIGYYHSYRILCIILSYVKSRLHRILYEVKSSYTETRDDYFQMTKVSAQFSRKLFLGLDMPICKIGNYPSISCVHACVLSHFSHV